MKNLKKKQIDLNMFFDKTDLNIKYIEATNFYNNGCLKIAKTLFQELILSDPFRWEYWYSIGAIYQLEKNYDEAVLSYKRAIVLNRSNAKIYFHLAECFLSLEDTKNALFSLDLAKKNCVDSILNDKILVLLEQNSCK